MVQPSMLMYVNLYAETKKLDEKFLFNYVNINILPELRRVKGVAQSLEYVLVYKGRFSKPEEYENIVVRANSNGEILHLKDIATIELGSEFQDIYSTVDGHPSSSIMIMVFSMSLRGYARQI